MARGDGVPPGVQVAPDRDEVGAGAERLAEGGAASAVPGLLERASLLLALAAHVDEHEDLQAGIAAVQAAPGAAGQVRAWAHMQAWRNPKIAPLARALDQARHTDQAASAAWRDRTGNRMRGAAAIITRLREEGRLHPSWTTSEAATLLWELTSFRVWDDLVNEAGLTPDRYVEIVTTAVLAALASPLSEQASPSPGSP